MTQPFRCSIVGTRRRMDSIRLLEPVSGFVNVVLKAIGISSYPLIFASKFKKIKDCN